jgi:hypothetical protein
LHAATAEVYFAVVSTNVVRYTDGGTASVELLSPVDLPPYRTTPFLRDTIVGSRTSSPDLSSSLAWAGTNPEVEARNETLFLTRTTWDLPEIHRGKTVRSLELRAGQAEAIPLVFAITVE